MQKFNARYGWRFSWAAVLPALSMDAGVRVV
jgi:hypothetical protein